MGKSCVSRRLTGPALTGPPASEGPPFRPKSPATCHAGPPFRPRSHVLATAQTHVCLIYAKWSLSRVRLLLPSCLCSVVASDTSSLVTLEVDDLVIRDPDLGFLTQAKKPVNDARMKHMSCLGESAALGYRPLLSFIALAIPSYDVVATLDTGISSP